MPPIRDELPKKVEKDEKKPYEKKGAVQPGWTAEIDAVLLGAVDDFIRNGIYPAVKDHPAIKAKFNGSGTASTSVKQRLALLIKQRKS